MSFEKTHVNVALFAGPSRYVSRSQARRLLAGLEKFRDIELDFVRVEGIGQGFADEVFRVWKARHPDVRIRVKNATDDVNFMIARAVAAARQASAGRRVLPRSGSS